jgi:uncharacterized protein (TIGR02145 family)
MKNSYKTKSILLSIIILCMAIFTSCSKSDDNDTPEPTVNLPELNTLSAVDISNIDAVSATISAGIITDGGTNITAKGICWSTGHNPNIEDDKTNDGTGTASFAGDLTKLDPNTVYYVRAYATNSAGTAYSNEITVTTTTSIKDIDGNSYVVVKIGTQIWTATNLKTTQYNDGTTIPTGLNNTQWANLTTGAYAIYDNTANNNTTYGKLYNWYAVNTGKLAPKGWHIPTDAEWTILRDYLGGESVAGGKMKSTSALWQSPNTGATNSSGFTGLPGGIRLYYGDFNGIEYYGYWWSATEIDATSAWLRTLTNSSNSLISYDAHKQSGFSVRCVRD